MQMHLIFERIAFIQKEPTVFCRFFRIVYEPYLDNDSNKNHTTSENHNINTGKHFRDLYLRFADYLAFLLRL